MHLGSNSIEGFCYRISWLRIIIDCDKGLSPSRQQAIIWTTDNTIHWRIFASSGPNMLIIYSNLSTFIVHMLFKNMYKKANCTT